MAEGSTDGGHTPDIPDHLREVAEGIYVDEFGRAFVRGRAATPEQTGLEVPDGEMLVTVTKHRLEAAARAIAAIRETSQG